MSGLAVDAKSARLTQSGRQSSPNPSSQNLRVQCPISPWASRPIGHEPRFDRIEADRQSTYNREARQSAVTKALRQQRENNQADCAENRADDLCWPGRPIYDW